MPARCLSKPPKQRQDYLLLKRGGQINDLLVRLATRPDGSDLILTNISQYCGLEPAEAEIKISRVHSRNCEHKANCRRISTGRQPVDYRSAGVTQSEQFGHFVERLAGCIIAGASYGRILARLGDQK